MQRLQIHHLQLRSLLNTSRAFTRIDFSPPRDIRGDIINRSLEIGLPLLEERLDAFLLVPVNRQHAAAHPVTQQTEHTLR